MVFFVPLQECYRMSSVNFANVGGVFDGLRARSRHALRAHRFVRRGLGALLAVAVSFSTSAFAQSADSALSAPAASATLPPFSGAVQWFNSPRLTPNELRGKVVLVNFWTYSCINCLRVLPYYSAWAKKYRDEGLVVIGVHTPEFAFERSADNVKNAVERLGIDYPVALDSNYGIWRAYQNQYWPALYVADAQGRIRYQHFGEGNYRDTERAIQQLLAERGASHIERQLVAAPSQGIGLAADAGAMKSPETYIGYEQASNFASTTAPLLDQLQRYSAPDTLPLNHWALTGAWTLGREFASSNEARSGIVYRFHARDLHLVLGPGRDGKPVKFRISIDGAPPGDAHGSDVAADGTGVVTQQRLYQLVRQNGKIVDHTFSIEFEEPGVDAYVFTFG
jgi:thiol-disulfide isomerase/thioredoxin